jgi:hypothetical protein
MPNQCLHCQVTNADLLKIVAAGAGLHPQAVAALPTAEFLMVTWTMAEANAMGVVFGLGNYSFPTTAKNNFVPYQIPGVATPEKSDEEKAEPGAAEATAHAYFFPVTVNGRSVLCLKCQYHPKKQPAETAAFFEKIIGPKAKPNYKYVITSGTAGGIWDELDVGDVVVTSAARFGTTMTAAEQQLKFAGVADPIGSEGPAGYATWYDYATDVILKNDACVNAGLAFAGGRKATSPKPTIYYEATLPSLTDVVSNREISKDEYIKIDTYRTLGATLDENDAYVAQALQSAGFQNWVSIRNISDLPAPLAPGEADPYDVFGPCSSINGAYAVWAFVMGHPV